MTKNSTPVSETPVSLGNRVTQEVSTLLGEIEKEAVPDRLLGLAQDLQKALAEKSADET